MPPKKEILQESVSSDMEVKEEVVEEVSRQGVLEALGVKEKDVLAYKEYSKESVVVITVAGRKLLWGNDPGNGSLYHNKQKPVQKKS